MNIMIKLENNSVAAIERQVSQECKKLEKFFYSAAKIHYKINNLKKGFLVKVSLKSGSNHFRGEAQGMQTDICISKATKRLVRSILLSRELS